MFNLSYQLWERYLWICLSVLIRWKWGDLFTAMHCFVAGVLEYIKRGWPAKHQHSLLFLDSRWSVIRCPNLLPL